MNTLTLERRVASLSRVLLSAAFAVLAACGSGDAPPPPELAITPTAPVAPTPPVIVQQPTSVTVLPGETATFTVVATGTAPLAYRWQRGSVDIAGATQASYTTPTVAATDSGAAFHVIVSNVAGTVTSVDAVLTVTLATPVLTINPQPASMSVAAGTSASFTVGGTCSLGTLTVQWQRAAAGGAFADIVGATSTAYTLMAASVSDNGAQFRALLTCSGQAAATSNVATLTVTAPTAVTLSAVPVVGLRAQATLNVLGAIDPAPAGGYDFVSGNAIDHLSADLSTVTPLAGAPGNGSTDGSATTARFSQPLGLVHDAAGNVYVADTFNQTIRRIALDGTVTTVAGTPGVVGYADGTGAAAQFAGPRGAAIGPDGDLYVADYAADTIRRVTAAGVVTTYAGVAGLAGFLDGAANVAQFSSPSALAFASNGDLYVADFGNNRIRRIVRAGNVAGAVQTLAGSGGAAAPYPDGSATTAVIKGPRTLVRGGTTLYVLDSAGLLRTVDTTSGAVGTFSGTRTVDPNYTGTNYADGPPSVARFSGDAPGIAVAAGGGFIVDDRYGIRTVDTSGNVVSFASTVANDRTASGTGVLAQEPFYFDDNPATSTIVVDATGRIDVSELGNRTIRRIDTAGNVTLVAGLAHPINFGTADGIGSAAVFAFNGVALAIAPDGTLYSSDNYGVRRVATNGATTFLAGSASAFGAMDGTASTALFGSIGGVAVGPTGDVFASDTNNRAIRRIDAAGNTTTYAGALGVSGSVDGPRLAARFQSPAQLSFSPDGTLYLIDNGVLRRIATDGTVSTIATGYGNVVVDATGVVYVVTNSSTNAQLGTIDPATGTFTRIITAGNTVNLGSAAPNLGPSIGAIYPFATKELLVVSGGQLLLVTIP